MVGTAFSASHALRAVELDATGAARVVRKGKQALADELHLSVCDMRLVDAAYEAHGAHEAAVIPRASGCVLVSVAPFRAVVQHDRVLIFDGTHPLLADVLPLLQDQIRAAPAVDVGRSVSGSVQQLGRSGSWFEFRVLETLLVAIVADAERECGALERAIAPHLRKIEAGLNMGGVPSRVDYDHGRQKRTIGRAWHGSDHVDDVQSKQRPVFDGVDEHRLDKYVEVFASEMGGERGRSARRRGNTPGGTEGVTYGRLRRGRGWPQQEVFAREPRAARGQGQPDAAHGGGIMRRAGSVIVEAFGRLIPSMRRVRTHEAVIGADGGVNSDPKDVLRALLPLNRELMLFDIRVSRIGKSFRELLASDEDLTLMYLTEKVRLFSVSGGG